MIAPRPKPFIFIHIPKCGGTSIEKALLPAATQRPDFYNLTATERKRYWLPGTRGLQHAKLRRIESDFDLAQFFKFSFVRNPWDRAVSQVEYLVNNQATRFLKKSNFKANLRTYCQINRVVWGHDLGACQSDYLESEGFEMDFVGRFERLQRDFKLVCKQLGLVPAPELPHIFNSCRDKHYSAYYDKESENWIRERFSRDIDQFGYKFERMAPPAV